MLRFEFIFTVLLGLLSKMSFSQGIPKLRDLVDPAEQTALRDALSAIVADELRNSNYADAAPVVEKEPYEDVARSISSLNAQYRDLLFQGDIRLSHEDLAELVLSSARRRARTAFRDMKYPTTIWKPYVPYALDSSLKGRARQSVLAAINFWRRHTCVKFVPRTNEEVYLYVIGSDDGCWSAVGRVVAQRRQLLNIGRGCEHFGITSHEMGHALGLFHEQSRYDRDSFVRIIAGRIPRRNYFDFAKVGQNQMDTYGTAYDVGSVMHYRPTEFSIDGNPTIVARNTNLQGTMGQMGGPNFLDVKKINAHYECGAVCQNNITCLQNGYQDPANCDVCRCPTGFGGPQCELVQRSTPPRCSGILRAGVVERRLTINMRPRANGIRNCNYHIVAPPGKRILLVVEASLGKCLQGCYEEGAELKFAKDKSLTGARFCCRLRKPRKIITEDNVAVVITNAAFGQTFIQLRYSLIEGSAASNHPKVDAQNYLKTLEKADAQIVDSEKIAEDFLVQWSDIGDGVTFSDVVLASYAH